MACAAHGSLTLREVCKLMPRMLFSYAVLMNQTGSSPPSSYQYPPHLPPYLHMLFKSLCPLLLFKRLKHPSNLTGTWDKLNHAPSEITLTQTITSRIKSRKCSVKYNQQIKIKMALTGITNSCAQINDYTAFLPSFNLDMQGPLRSLEQKAEAYTKVDDTQQCVAYTFDSSLYCLQ